VLKGLSLFSSFPDHGATRRALCSTP
jgi:hypothetical protein